MSNIIIRNLSDFDKEILGELMAIYDEKTASKAIIKLLRDFRQLKARESVMEQMTETLQTENAELREKIENLRKSFKELQ